MRSRSGQQSVWASQGAWWGRVVVVLWVTFGLVAPPVGSVEYIDDEQISRSLTAAVRKAAEDGSLHAAGILRRTRRMRKPRLPLLPPAEVLLPADALYRTVMDRVLIHCRVFTGIGSEPTPIAFSTAFPIAPDVVVMNHHAVDDDRVLFHVMADRQGTLYPVKEILAADEDNDIVIAKVEGDVRDR